MNKENLRSELNKFDNVSDMFNYLNKTFDLSQKLGFISKPAIIQGLLTAYDILKPKIK